MKQTWKNMLLQVKILGIAKVSGFFFLFSFLFPWQSIILFYFLDGWNISAWT